MDLYGVLGVERSASAEEIKKAYRRLAMKHHPDRPNGDAGTMAAIQKAYDILSDDDKRAQYDAGGEDALNFETNIEAQAIQKLSGCVHQLLSMYTSEMANSREATPKNMISDVRTSVGNARTSADVTRMQQERLLVRLSRFEKKFKSKKTKGFDNLYETAVSQQIAGTKATIKKLELEIKIANRAMELIDDLEYSNEKSGGVFTRLLG